MNIRSAHERRQHPGSKHHGSRRLRLEWLEKREVLAGNVLAAVVAGDLVITGTNGPNGVRVAEVGVNTFKVTGLGAGGPTTINGAASATLGGVTDDININLLLGNDVLQVDRIAILGDLHVDTNGGADHAKITRAAIRGNLLVETKGGNDTVWIENTTVGGLPGVVGGAANIETGEGADQVTILRLTTAGGAHVNTGIGNDTLSVRDSAFANLNIATGDGADTAHLTRVAARNNIGVDMGDNADKLVATRCTAASVDLKGGPGTADDIDLSFNSFGTSAIGGFEV
jgi:hypothetical protein